MNFKDIRTLIDCDTSVELYSYDGSENTTYRVNTTGMSFIGVDTYVFDEYTVDSLKVVDNVLVIGITKKE